MLRRKFFKRKKRKKESGPIVWKEIAMQYFFAKSIAVFSVTGIVFAKNPSGLEIVSAFC
ncbi:MAG: hypothetical protein K0M63_09885 [Weeksellaceae bacterium]|nr:hypothetical protein [Weeksellaceae bacterium]